MSVSLRYSDVIVLDEHVEFCSDGLADKLSGRFFPANRTALEAAALMDGSRALGEVGETIASRYGAPLPQVMTDLRQLLDQLDRFALLRIVRTSRATIGHGAEQVRSLGHPGGRRRLLMSLQTFSWLDIGTRAATRYAPTAAGVVKASWRAHAAIHVALAGLGLFTAWLVLLTRPGPVSDRFLVDVLALPVLFPVLFLVVMAAHELGHFYTIKAVGQEVRYLVVRGLNIRILHSHGDGWPQRLIGLSGPLMALATGVALSAALAAVQAIEIAVLFAATLGFAHLVNLGPWASDGRVLFARSDRPRTGKGSTGHMSPPRQREGRDR
jgi:hypothetical protein